MNARTLVIIAIILLAAILLTLYFNNRETKRDCRSFTADTCPQECVVCPPCIYCSSISCQTEEFCQSIGFNRSWWEEVKPPSNND